jgi:hypothetical protein
VLATLTPDEAARAAAEAAATLRPLTAEAQSARGPAAQHDANTASQAPAPVTHS